MLIRRFFFCLFRGWLEGVHESSTGTGGWPNVLGMEVTCLRRQNMLAAGNRCVGTCVCYSSDVLVSPPDDRSRQHLRDEGVGREWGRAAWAVLVVATIAGC